MCPSISFGNWNFSYNYIDEKAAPEQRKALEAIAAKVMVPGASKKTETRYVPIDLVRKLELLLQLHRREGGSRTAESIGSHRCQSDGAGRIKENRNALCAHRSRSETGTSPTITSTRRRLPNSGKHWKPSLPK